MAAHLLVYFSFADRVITRAFFGEKIRDEVEPLLVEAERSGYERGLKEGVPHVETEATPQESA